MNRAQYITHVHTRAHCLNRMWELWLWIGVPACAWTVDCRAFACSDSCHLASFGGSGCSRVSGGAAVQVLAGRHQGISYLCKPDRVLQCMVGLTWHKHCADTLLSMKEVLGTEQVLEQFENRCC